MKVAISAQGKTMDDLMDVRFGRCEFFAVYDLEAKKLNVIENNGNLSGGGAGITAAQQIIDENIDVVISGNVGPNAFELLDEAKIKIYKGENTSIKKLLELYQNNDLVQILKSGPAHHGMNA